MTYIQIFTGGQPIHPDAITQAGVRTLFAADVTDWAEPPQTPDMPSTMRVADMPPTIKAALNKAMAQALYQTTGQRWAIQGD